MTTEPWSGIFTRTTDSCEFRDCYHCGCWHYGVCPKIDAIEYNQDGSIRRVEYRPTGLRSPLATDAELVYLNKTVRTGPDKTEGPTDAQDENCL